MALQATPYKISLDISDVDRGVYEAVKFTIARHPSETELRLVARILAYALFYHEYLSFGRGLSDTDEAALWQVNLSGEIDHWIDVGQPDADRMIRASRKAPKMSVLAYGNLRIWSEKTIPKIAHLSNVTVLGLPETLHAELATQVSRNTHWGVMITDNVLYVSHDSGQIEIPLQNLHGARD
ncbi:YaeQ family protein [Aliidiomarina sanyensis]|uniref:YaeQ family protein n=1 Tax=Aliidiomarina sanyensis TaxID=1249555 RepID=A0A432WQE5_9GAMM|nr:YaeQ family protein [Aliidiomarina sanyensis]RUO35897.1 hypothetical protein CWE11_03070 [Aliidiomarina sanyensis]